MNNFRIPRKNLGLQKYVNLKCRKFAIKYGIYAVAVFLAEVGFLFGAVSSCLGTVNAAALAAILFIAPFFIFAGIP